LLFALTSLSIVACGGDDGDDIQTPDARVDGATGSDGPAAVCSVSTGNFGDKGALAGNALFTAATAVATDDILEFDALLETAQPADGIAIILYAGYGAFDGAAITPGTYQIAGDELDFATCGVCVVMSTNVTSTGYEDDYMATGGTVTITAAGSAVGGTMSGSLSNVTFHHAEIAMGNGDTTISDDSCTSAITNATFTGTLAAAPMNKPGRALSSARKHH